MNVQANQKKAIPMTPADVERWLEGTPEEALALQRPAPDDTIVIDPALEKKAA